MPFVGGGGFLLIATIGRQDTSHVLAYRPEITSELLSPGEDGVVQSFSYAIIANWLCFPRFV